MGCSKSFRRISENARALPSVIGLGRLFIAIFFFASPVLADDVPKIIRFILIDAEKDQPLLELQNGDSLELDRLPADDINVAVETRPKKISQVVFSLNGVQRFREETVPPYALAGDSGGDYKAWTPRVGENIIVATPFLQGKQGEAERLVLHIVEKRKPTASASVAPPRAGERSVSQGERSKQNSCQGFFNAAETLFTVVCSHNVDKATAASIRSSSQGVSALCEFSNALSPMVANCAVSDSVISALKSGDLYVRLESNREIVDPIPVVFSAE